MTATFRQRRSFQRSWLGMAGLSAVAGLTATFTQPAAAANVSCQAINATSVIGGPLPTSNCSRVAANDTFEIDLSDIFAANGGTLPVNKFYSLQIANLNTGASNTLSFQDVEFLVTGDPQPAGPITIWSSSTLEAVPAFPLAQGLSNYTTSGNTGMFGMTNVASKASFDLTGPVTPGWPNIGTAGLISTFPIDLSAAGITQFTGAKIRGKFLGSNNAVTAFSAGLAQFASNPLVTPQQPAAIFGNAFNVPAPGPLPLLGAGAAFGMSRRLRRRIGAQKVAA